MLITFPYESITRFLGHEDHPDTFDRLFGTEAWRDAPVGHAEARRRFLHDLYRDQLRREAGIEYVRSFQMRDSGNRTEYFLFFGTHHIKGMEAMKDAMWKADPSGRFQFSDFTDANQPVLFELEPDFDQLAGQIIGQFSGCEVTVEKIEEFVLAETPFKSSHYKKNVLRKLEFADPPLIGIVRSPRKRRGTYPPGTVIRFP